MSWQKNSWSFINPVDAPRYVHCCRNYTDLSRNLCWYLVLRYAAIWTMSTVIPESNSRWIQPRCCATSRINQSRIKPEPIHQSIRELRSTCNQHHGPLVHNAGSWDRFRVFSSDD